MVELGKPRSFFQSTQTFCSFGSTLPGFFWSKAPTGWGSGPKLTQSAVAVAKTWFGCSAGLASRFQGLYSNFSSPRPKPKWVRRSQPL